ncbi:M20/M25/M40 family metallo-hydrolase [Cupriavidus basilensis]
MDDLVGRHQPQRDPGYRHRTGRCARAAHRRLRQPGAHAAGTRKKQLIPGTRVEVKFERRRPPLEATDAARKLAAHAQGVYAEIGEKLAVHDTAEGGGTDAAFAAAATKAPVIERFGLRGFGAHSNDAEYVDLNSVTPRLYLLTRMIMDVSQDKTGR